LIKLNPRRERLMPTTPDPEERPATPDELARKEEIMRKEFVKHAEAWAAATPVEERLARRQARIDSAG
jgi:hypothetical protein